MIIFSAITRFNHQSLSNEEMLPLTKKRQEIDGNTDAKSTAVITFMLALSNKIDPHSLSVTIATILAKREKINDRFFFSFHMTVIILIRYYKF
jgi:hypothetical protein